MKYIKKILFVCLFICLFVCVSGGKAALIKKESITQTSSFNTGFYNTTDTTANSIGNIIAVVIKGFLSLLGIIFLIILVVAGWKYMNARGNEDEVKTALTMIRHAIIGLIIVILAYAITAFVFSSLDSGSGSNPVTGAANG